MNNTSNFLQSAAAQALLRSAVPANPAARLDSADETRVVFDAAVFAMQNISMAVAASIQTWCEGDLAEGEGPADRLMAMLVGIADENKDGELTEEESAIIETAANEAWSYMAAKGVAESDLDDLFNADDPEVANAAGMRICEFLAGNLPDGEAADDEIDNFAFGPEAQEGLLDNAGQPRLDAVYKKRFVVRGGKKTVVRKRISGTVRLSAAQKLAIRKARTKAHGARAQAKRMKSLRVRKSIGLGR